MSATQPFISVIVPTRNRVDWLRRCLDGIAEQDFPDYEVVVVDDGSSGDVLVAYQQMMEAFGPRYRLLKANTEGGRRLGPSVVRNIGIDAAKGTYIAFCDDDDYWCQSDLLSIAAGALRETDADLHFANQKIMHGDTVFAKTSFRRVEASIRQDQRLADWPVYQITREQMLCYPDYAHLNITIARKALLEKIGGFWEETRYAEDVDLFVRLCDTAAGHILFRPDVCSAHNAPVTHGHESASKGVGDLNRRLLENSVYWHLLASCHTPAAVRYAKLSLYSNTKLLYQELQQRDSIQAAAAVARIALATRPSFKWSIYCAWLSIRALCKPH